MKSKKKNIRGKSKPNGKPKSQLEKMGPLPAKSLTIEEIHETSSPKLLVTAMYLAKKAKKEPNKKKKIAMKTIAGYIANIISVRLDGQKPGA